MEAEDGWVLCYPEYPNTTCWIRSSTTGIMVFDSAMYFTSVFTVVLNLLIIISVSHFRQLHTPTNMLLLSLAVSDFLVGLLPMPLQTIIMSHCWLFGDFWCSLYRFVSFIIHSASLGNMVLISIDRYLAICDPLHYSTIITVNRVKVSVCVLWFCSVASNAYFYLMHIVQHFLILNCFGTCETLSYNVATYTQVILNFLAPVTVIVVLYMTVFTVAVSQARAMRSHITDVKKQISVTKTAKKSELKAARTLGVLVVVFLMCLLPNCFVSFTGDKFLSNSGIYITQYLYFLNSFLNPVIYALLYPWFRKTVKLILTLEILQPGSCELNVL